MEGTQPSMELQSSQKPIKEEWGGMQMKPTTRKRSVRCTRSQVVPNWSLHELLFLVNETAAIESDFLNSLSSYQKWKIISDNCTSLGVVRSLNQCRRQWNTLLEEYNTIKDWESQTGVSYWSLDTETILEHGLPRSFDNELFIFIDDNVKAQDERSGVDTDSDPDFNVMMDRGSKKKRRCQPPRIRNSEEEQKMAMKLREQADLIHGILKGDTECNSNNGFKSPAPGESPTEFRRWQGSELIKVLGSLVGAIDQLSGLVQEGGGCPLRPMQDKPHLRDAPVAVYKCRGDETRKLEMSGSCTCLTCRFFF